MSILAHDTFVEASDTLLGSHVSNTGQGWTQTGDSVETITVKGGGGYVLQTSDSPPGDAIYTVNVDPPTADYTVEATLFDDFAGVDCFPQLIFRQQSGVATRYAVYWAVIEGTLNLQRKVAGADTLLGTVSLTAGSAHVAVTGTGAHLSVTVDGVSVIEHDDASPISTAGRGGIGFSAGGNPLSQHLNNFTLSDAAGGGSAKDAMIHHLRTMGAY